jgi:hypothetical protein
MVVMSERDNSPQCNKKYRHIPAVPAETNDFEIYLGYDSPGGDFFNHLAENGQDVRKALKAWSMDLARQSALLERLAEKIDVIQVQRIHAQDRPDFAHISASDEAGRQVLIEAVRSGLLHYTDYLECDAGDGFHVLEE